MGKRRTDLIDSARTRGTPATPRTLLSGSTTAPSVDHHLDAVIRDGNHIVDAITTAVPDDDSIIPQVQQVKANLNCQCWSDTGITRLGDAGDVINDRAHL